MAPARLHEGSQQTSHILLVAALSKGKGIVDKLSGPYQCGVSQAIQYLLYEVQHVICFPKYAHPFPFQLSNVLSYHRKKLSQLHPRQNLGFIHIYIYVSPLVNSNQSELTLLVKVYRTLINIIISYSKGLHRAVKCRWQ